MTLKELIEDLERIRDGSPTAGMCNVEVKFSGDNHVSDTIHVHRDRSCVIVEVKGQRAVSRS